MEALVSQQTHNKQTEIGLLLNTVELIKLKDYSETARMLGKSEEALRQELSSKSTMVFGDGLSGINIEWSFLNKENNKAWLPKDDPDYKWPAAILKISDILHLYFIEVGLRILQMQEHPLEDIYAKLATVADEYLELARKVIENALQETNNDHVCVHLYEAYTTLCLTIVEFTESMTSDELLLDSKQDLYCHPLLGGLTVVNYNLESKQGKRSTQKARAPSSGTNRTGKEVSFEELANVFRTSRVTLANVFNTTIDAMKRKVQRADTHYSSAQRFSIKA